MAKTDVKCYPNFDNEIFLRSCEEEINVPVQGKVTGEIPSWLRGTLLRNGPGSFKVGEMKYKHVFDGAALLHRFAIADGEATYQCRFLRSETYKKNQAANRIVVTEFGTKAVPDPCHTIFDRMAARFHPDKMMTDNALVAVYPFGDEIYAFTESAIIHRIDPVTLDTLERKNLMYNVIVCHSAHPHVMPNGDVYNVGVSVVNLKVKHVVVKFPFKEKGDMFKEAEVVGTMAPRWPLHPSYMHSFVGLDTLEVCRKLSLLLQYRRAWRGDSDSSLVVEQLGLHLPPHPRYHLEARHPHQLPAPFAPARTCYASNAPTARAPSLLGITDNYFVIVDQPLSISIPSLVVNQMTNEPVSACMKWYPEYQTHIVLICRKTGEEVKRFVTPTLFYVHIVNTFERDGTIVLDICSYDDAKVLDAMYVEALENVQGNPNYADWCRSRPKRLELHLDAPNMTWVKGYVLADVGCELPRMHYDLYNGKPYRYFYAISADVDRHNPGALIKVDTKTGDFLVWSEKDCTASEPVFVAAPDAKEEDDGVLLSALLSSADACAVSLVVLDARTMRERGRVQFATRSPAPKCLHGWFLPA